MWLRFKPKRVGRDRERGKKNSRSNQFLPDLDYRIPNKKKSKKIQKIIKHDYGYFSSQNGMGLAEKEKKKKIIVPINSFPTSNREFQKKRKKIQKIKKHNYGFFSSRNGLGVTEKE